MTESLAPRETGVKRHSSIWLASAETTAEGGGEFHDGAPAFAE